MQSGGPKPTTLCAPPAIPVNEVVPAPYKIIQTPGLMLMLIQGDNTSVRFTPTGGSIL